VTEHGQEALKRLTKLRELYLPEAATDSTVLVLKGLPDLRELSLAGTAVSDDALRNLAVLKNLESLSLDRTGITDAGLALLAPLGNLEFVSLKRTLATEEGVDKLRKALPKAHLFQR
jgi:hypothetical protein